MYLLTLIHLIQCCLVSSTHTHTQCDVTTPRGPLLPSLHFALAASLFLCRVACEPHPHPLPPPPQRTLLATRLGTWLDRRSDDVRWVLVSQLLDARTGLSAFISVGADASCAYAAKVNDDDDDDDDAKHDRRGWPAWSPPPSSSKDDDGDEAQAPTITLSRNDHDALDLNAK
jgi:hypothetical protein